MKKMMLVAAAVCAAAVAQAVNVAWGITVDKAYAGATAYIIEQAGDVTTSSIETLIKGGTTDLTSYKWGTGDPQPVKSTGLVNVTAKNSGIEMPNGTSDSPTSATAFIALLFKDSEGNWKYAITDTMTKQHAGVGTPSFAFGDQTGLAWNAASGGGGGGGDDPIIPDVPEPTSMALVALGAAAFGLRRKLRK